MSQFLFSGYSKLPCSRRDFLSKYALMAGSALAGTQILSSLPAASLEPVRKVAGILTWYKRGSHADVLIGKILEGWRYDGGVGPRLELASLYVDQFPEDDMARALSEKHGFPIFNSIEDDLSLQSDALAVDGVLSIGEHGDYPINSKGQKLYPRKRFFEGITRAFRQLGRVVPVFSDKHLGPVWEDAKWMYDQAQALNIPFMAGSSLPVSFRQPEWAPPMGSSMMAAVGVGYSGLDYLWDPHPGSLPGHGGTSFGGRDGSQVGSMVWSRGNVAEGRGWNGRCQGAAGSFGCHPKGGGHSRLSAGSGRRWGGLVPL